MRITEIYIEDIDLVEAPKIKGIYMIQTWDRVYIGKSTNIFGRLKYHKTNTFPKNTKRMYILEAYKDITDLDLMVMEDFYICKFKALGYNLENRVDAIPPKLRSFLRGGKQWIKPYKQFKNMESDIFDIEIRETKTKRKRAYLINTSHSKRF